MRFSTYNNYKDPKPTGEIGIEEYLKNLISNKDERLIADVRMLKARGSKYSSVKEKISGVTISGTFTYRSEKDLIKHSGLIALDFDEILPEEITSVKRKLQDDPYVFCYQKYTLNAIKKLSMQPVNISSKPITWSSIGPAPMCPVTVSTLSTHPIITIPMLNYLIKPSKTPQDRKNTKD
jgi:hypothetical protein